MKFECATCGGESQLKVLASVELVTPSLAAGNRTHEIHTFGQCASCLNVAVLMRLDWYQIHDHAGESDLAAGVGDHRVYPPTDRFERGIPAAVKSGLIEARRCVEARAYRAAVLMCRTTLEAVCADLGCKRGSLANNLRYLSEVGEIDGRMYEWAEALRSHGNSAAHEQDADFSWEDARDLLEFTETLLLNIFQIGARFDRYMKRQASKPA